MAWEKSDGCDDCSYGTGSACQAFIPEVFLQEKESLLRRLSGKYQENIAREVWEAYPEHHEVDKWHSISEKGIDPQAIPSLQVVAGVNAAFAVSERKLSANDISDFQHAAVAVPYFDALFCDGGMATMLNDKPLKFGKIYNTIIMVARTKFASISFA